jgi:putative transposase
VATHHDRQSIRIPRGWKRSVRSAALHAIALARYAIAHAHARAATDDFRRTRLRGEIDRLRQEVALLREELRIKDTRMAALPPQRRPHYRAGERLAILELRAARGWSLAQTARAFLITSLTIAHWMRRLDEQGPHALVQLRDPVNKFPEFVEYLVQRLKVLCPALGKRQIATTLARAGLHLGQTTVGRMLNRSPRFEPPRSQSGPSPRVVHAKQINHIWHVDLTTVPIGGGFWTTWLPLAVPQCWPLCWWVAVVVDHFSRRVMGIATFSGQPTSVAIRAFLGRTIQQAGGPPKHLICDIGSQFWCAGFKAWCRRRGIRPRFGAVGKQGSIAVVERFIRTLKTSCTRRLLVPLCRESFRRELTVFAEWYNEHRPHATLGGRTPNEVYYAHFPKNRRPRYEPRSRWPRGSPCAKPWALMRGAPGARLALDITFHGGRRHLPIVSLRRVA